MNKFELYKSFYDREQSRKAEINNALNIPITITIVLFSVLYYIFTNFDFSLAFINSIVFIILVFVTLIFLLISVYYVIKALNNGVKGTLYLTFSDSQALLKWEKDTEGHYKKEGMTSDEIDDLFKSQIIKDLAEIADNNAMANDDKFESIFQAKKYLVYGLFFTIIMMLPYLYNFFTKKDAVYKVEVPQISIIERRLIEIDSNINKLHQAIKLNTSNYERQEYTTPSATTGEDTTTSSSSKKIYKSRSKSN